MTDKNYIEIVHEFPYDNEDWQGEDRDIWWAVSPTEGDYRMWRKGDPEEPWAESGDQKRAWKINGELYIGSVDDINGLRKLLDALEQEFS